MSWTIFFLKTVAYVWIKKLQQQMNNYKLIIGIEFYYGNALNWTENEIVLHWVQVTAMQTLTADTSEIFNRIWFRELGI